MFNCLWNRWFKVCGLVLVFRVYLFRLVWWLGLCSMVLYSWCSWVFWGRVMFRVNVWVWLSLCRISCLMLWCCFVLMLFLVGEGLGMVGRVSISLCSSGEMFSIWFVC